MESAEFAGPITSCSGGLAAARRTASTGGTSVRVGRLRLIFRLNLDRTGVSRCNRKVFRGGTYREDYKKERVSEVERFTVGKSTEDCGKGSFVTYRYGSKEWVE